jgi:hypothetical protein
MYVVPGIGTDSFFLSLGLVACTRRLCSVVVMYTCVLDEELNYECLDVMMHPCACLFA